jgi:hypothetical protein
MGGIPDWGGGGGFGRGLVTSHVKKNYHTYYKIPWDLIGLLGPIL